MAESEKARRAAKGALTRQLNTIRRLIAEEESELVKSAIDTLRDKFNDFCKAHERYHALFEEDDDLESVNDLKLVLCTPNYPSEIDVTEEWQDIMPDMECDESYVPDEILEAQKKLNELIRAANPISWSMGKKRVNISSLQ